MYVCMCIYIYYIYICLCMYIYYIYVYVYVQTHLNCLGGPYFDPPNPTTVWVQYQIVGTVGIHRWFAGPRGPRVWRRPLQWNSWPSEGMPTANLLGEACDPAKGAMTKKNRTGFQVLQVVKISFGESKHLQLTKKKTLQKNQSTKKRNSSQHPLLSLKMSGTTWKPHDLQMAKPSISWHLAHDLGPHLTAFKNPPEGVGVFVGKMDGLPWIAWFLTIQNHSKFDIWLNSGIRNYWPNPLKILPALEQWRIYWILHVAKFVRRFVDRCYLAATSRKCQEVLWTVVSNDPGVGSTVSAFQRSERARGSESAQRARARKFRGKPSSLGRVCLLRPGLLAWKMYWPWQTWQEYKSSPAGQRQPKNTPIAECGLHD